MSRTFNTGALAKVFSTSTQIDTAGERCVGFWVEEYTVFRAWLTLLVDGFEIITKLRRQRNDSDLALLLRQHFDLAVHPAPEMDIAPAEINCSGYAKSVGVHDLILNLGFTLANGRKQYPDAIVLTIIDTHGKARQFDLIGPAAVGGRVDPLIVPLPTGSTFSLPIDLDKYWPAASKEFEYKFQRGSCSLEAQFRGKAVSLEEANLDVKGIALMPYWTGTVASNQVQFEVQ